MRIEKIRFGNLNSLSGSWELDLTLPEYRSDGIFVISGPTGAGKSTILDALCLALYGRTPRLANISVNVNDLMSRQCAECHAEVEFSAGGRRYLCSWRQRRARKSLDGNLQQARHEIASLPECRIIKNTLSAVPKEVERITGLDYVRFTRSMLLAQGGFDNFLKARSSERSPILEQLTGTEIYTDISVRAFRKAAEEKQKLELLQAAMDGNAPLDEAALAALRAEQEEAREKAVELAILVERSRKALEWLGKIAALMARLRELEDEGRLLSGRQQAFAPGLRRLELGRKAAAAEGAFARLAQCRSEQEADGRSLREILGALPRLEELAQAAELARGEAAASLARATAGLEEAGPVLRKVRDMDAARQAQERILSGLAAEMRALSSEIGHAGELAASLGRKHAEALGSAASLEGWCRENSADAMLVESFSGLEQRMAALIAREKELGRKRLAAAEAERKLALAQKRHEDAAAGSNDAGERLARARSALESAKGAEAALLDGHSLDDMREMLRGLFREQALHREIDSLRGRRARLRDGQPCPLCGATRHPYAEGNIPSSDETERALEALEKRIKSVEQAAAHSSSLAELAAAAEREATMAGHRAELAGREAAACERELRTLRAESEAMRADVVAARELLARDLRPFGCEGAADLAGVRAALAARLRAWRDKNAELERLRQDIAAREKDIAALEIARKEKESILAARESSALGQQAALDGLLRARRDLFGDRNPDEEEARLKAGVQEADERVKSAREGADKTGRELADARGRAGALRARLEGRAHELERLQADFNGELAIAGFVDEAAWAEARLDADAKDMLGRQATELEREAAALSARQRDRAAELQALRSSPLSERSPEDPAEIGAAERELAELEEKHRHALSRISEIGGKLAENERARMRLARQREECLAQQAEWERWQRLSLLIGSADGKKFRNFAQGLTFELLLAHANEQLRKMSDRYLLVPGDDALEIGVRDYYQDGQARTTRNLSGGECFLVSLALALGLSRMAGRSISVDSLFLDEGFGSLDEDALDSALNTLAGLRNENKLIGVISHIQTLKERFGLRIEVCPGPGGKSRIEGPGCRRLG